MTTRDLGLIAALYCLNFQETRVFSENVRRIEFEFSEDTISLVKSYYDGSLLLPALQYFQSLKTVKNRINYIKDTADENLRHIYR